MGFDNFGVYIQEEGESHKADTYHKVDDTYNDFRLSVSKFLSDLTDDVSIAPLIPVFNLKTQVYEYAKKNVLITIVKKKFEAN